MLFSFTPEASYAALQKNFYLLNGSCQGQTNHTSLSVASAAEKGSQESSGLCLWQSYLPPTNQPRRITGSSCPAASLTPGKLRFLILSFSLPFTGLPDARFILLSTPIFIFPASERLFSMPGRKNQSSAARKKLLPAGEVI